MRQDIIDEVYLRLLRQSPIILKLKGNSTKFFSMRNTKVTSKYCS